MPIYWSRKEGVSLKESRTFLQAIFNSTVLITSPLFFYFLILTPAFLRATQGTKGQLFHWAIKYGSLGTLDKEDIFCVLREVNYERKESDLPKIQYRLLFRENTKAI